MKVNFGEKLFQTKYCHAFHTRLAVFFPLPSCCVSSLWASFNATERQEEEDGKSLVCYKRDRAINRVFCRELYLALMFPGRLQKDLFKGKWSLAKSYFKQDYRLRRLPSSPVLLRELVRPSLACVQTSPLPRKKNRFFFWGSGDVCIQAGPSPIFFIRLASNAFPDVGSVGRIEKKNLKNKKSQGVSE